MPRAPERIVGVRGHEDDLDRGPLQGDLPRGLPAAHARHDHVAQQEIDDAGVAVWHLQGRAIRNPPPAPCGPGRAAWWPRARAAPPRLRPGGSSPCRGAPAARRRGRTVLHRLVHAREVQPESRSPSGRAVDLDVAVALLHDPVDRGQAQARALPCALVVKKGSNTWDRVSSSIPQPVSDTASMTNEPAARAGGASSSSARAAAFPGHVAWWRW